MTAAGKTFTAIASVFLRLVALLHLLRVIQAWPVTVNGVAVPQAASVVAFFVAGILSVMLWREAQR